MQDKYVQIQSEPSALAIQIGESFPRFIDEKAVQILNAQQADKRADLQKWRQEAELKYQEAKERKEKSKPVPRATLDIDPHFEDMLPAFRRASLIAEIYAVETQPRKNIFIQDGHLLPPALALLDVLDNVDLHALSPDEFGVDKLRNASSMLEKMREQMGHTAALNTFELLALTKALDALPNDAASGLTAAQFNQLDKKGKILAAQALLCDEEHTPVPRAAALCKRASEKRRDIAVLDDALEFAFADAWFAYSEKMKFGNLEKLSDEEREQYTTEDNPNDVHPKFHSRIVETRLANAFIEFSALKTEEQARNWFNQLIPVHSQYAKLQALREQYREIVEQGGWETVPPDRMFAGGHAPLVKNLKKRLAVEGYYTGTIDDAFDAPLTAAIKSYQKHHQLEETGEVGEVFWRSLNVPATQRLAEIEVNIRRWHKTLFEPVKTFVYINIPSFTAELWHEDKLVATHRCVVGSSTKMCNTRTREWELMNSTHLMHAHMTYIVFNPYWNVPPRIEVDEFLPKMAADPKWLENSDYEYVNPKGGGRVLRQKPGENNALGKVKLIFPNRYNVYLHDTPKQGMFNYPVRAFSHGCMRVEKAMNLAREILEIDGQWNKKEVDRYFKASGEHAVDLNTPVDVFIEYHTVTVDEDGKPYFLADIYKIIRDEITPPTELQRRCDPAVDRTSQFRSGGTEDSGP